MCYTKEMKRLVIIDGKSVFYRGYYAMGALSTSDGTPTGGIYGFAAIAMEIVRKLDPTKVIVAWDSKSSTKKRKELYADYKAGRTKPGDDFYVQIPLLKELVLALGWSFVECDGYEADDIIGALSLQADEETFLARSSSIEKVSEWETYIVSSDLDMLQIVDENTRMYRILKGFSRLEELDVPAVERKYGIKKSQFLDLKALKGDTSDNIPGVAGIGEKTAVKLLVGYETLDGVYAALEGGQIKGKIAEKLAAGKQSAYMSRELAQIMTDAPVRLQDYPDLVIDKPRIIAALEKLEFRSLIRRFSSLGKKNTNDNKVPLGETLSETMDDDSSVRSDYNLAVTRVKNTRKSNAGAKPVPRKTAGATSGSDSISMQQTLEVPSYATDGTLISWDVKDLMHKKPAIADEILTKGLKYWDLAQGAFLLNPLVRKIDRVEEALEYQRQQAEFAENPDLYKILTQFDLPLIPVLYKMEEYGMLVDRQYFETLRREFSSEVAAIESEVWKLAGREFNINSPMQLSEVLFNDLSLPTKGIKKTARGYSTGVKELDKLEKLHPIIAKIKAYREATKLLSTYIEPLPELADAVGRVHTTFNQNVTATGRLSSTNPNLQNIPVRTEVGRRIRTGFIAPEGKVLVSADYSQFELRLAAVLANDEQLIADFNQDIDIHTKTAAEAFGVPMSEVTKIQRRAAKVINFGILYGMSVRGLADAAKMSYEEAKKFIEHYFELRKPIKTYLEQILTQARELGYVETYYGRRRPTPDVLSSNFIVRTGAERAAQNMPIQGTEADLMKRAMQKIDQALPEGSRMIMQVHDSVIVECSEEDAKQISGILQQEMENVAPELAVRLVVDVSVGKNWGEL